MPCINLCRTECVKAQNPTGVKVIDQNINGCHALGALLRCKPSQVVIKRGHTATKACTVVQFDMEVLLFKHA